MTLQKGSVGPMVTSLQARLIQLGILPLNEDGMFGPETFSAVERFQSAHSMPITGVADDTTLSRITDTITAQIAGGYVPWMGWMRAHLGEAELTGAAATDFDDDIASHTSYGNLDGVMVPGCAMTACAALEESGFKSPHNAAAVSFADFGAGCVIKPGCIVVFKWAGGGHHVTFCDHIIDDKMVACLGGNQGHQVKVSIFSRSFITASRWPTETLEVPKKTEE